LVEVLPDLIKIAAGVPLKIQPFRDVGRRPRCSLGGREFR